MMRGILFKPDMIKAIAEGRTTITRRLAGLKEINKEPSSWNFCGNAVRVIPPVKTGDSLFQHADGHCVSVRPRYRVGETVYIKEAYSHYGNAANLGLWVAGVQYKLDSEIRHIPFNDHRPPDERWWNTGKPISDYQSPMFMPEWAARTFIKITDVRPERLKDITEEDCRAEGIENTTVWVDKRTMRAMEDSTRKVLFQELWDSINGKEYPFGGNPWCWRICFKVLLDTCPMAVTADGKLDE